MTFISRAIDGTRRFALRHLSPIDAPPHERVIPRLARPETYDFSSNQFTFSPAEIKQIILPAIVPPPIGQDYCIEQLPAVVEARFRLPGVGTESLDIELTTCSVDLTLWLTQLYSLPEIHSIPVSLAKPGVLGKDYSQPKGKDLQPHLDFGTEAKAKCRHGMMKQDCAICRGETRTSNVTTRIQRLDIFELILPILQPPPGESLNNRLWFPEGCDLYDHQRTGIKFLAEHEHALLADEMGLGKSIQAIVAMRLLFRSGKVVSVLIVCTKSLGSDWKEKLWDWAPELPAIRVDGNPEARRGCWEANHPIHIVTYETLREDIEVLEGKSFDLCILDEGQKIRNPDGACQRV